MNEWTNDGAFAAWVFFKKRNVKSFSLLAPISLCEAPSNILMQMLKNHNCVFITDTDPRVLEKQELQQPTYVALSYINR